MPMTFIDKVRKICDLKGISQKKFSDISGIPYPTIKNYSTRGGTPSFEKMIELSKLPELRAYADILLEQDAVPDEEMREFNALFDELEKAGKGQQALDYLRFLASQKGD